MAGPEATIRITQLTFLVITVWAREYSSRCVQNIFFSTASVEIVFLLYDSLVRVDEDFIFIYDFLLQP